VGEIICDCCGKSIIIHNHDNIVDEIKMIGNNNRLKFSFYELYKLSWKYVSQIEVSCGINLSEVLANVDKHTNINIIIPILKKPQDYIQLEITNIPPIQGLINSALKSVVGLSF